MPGGYHHDEFEMEDGNLLCLTEDLTSETVEDMCVLLDRNTGEILRKWDYKESFQKAFGDLSEDASKWFTPRASASPEAGPHMTGSTTTPYGMTRTPTP